MKLAEQQRKGRKPARTVNLTNALKHGFETCPSEWGHHDFRGRKSYPVLDISFTGLAAGTTKAEPVSEEAAAP